MHAGAVFGSDGFGDGVDFSHHWSYMPTVPVYSAGHPITLTLSCLVTILHHPALFMYCFMFQSGKYTDWQLAARNITKMSGEAQMCVF